MTSLSGDVRLPGSKNTSNRALLLAAMDKGRTRLANLLHGDDTKFMPDALKTLDIEIHDEGNDLVVDGANGPLVTNKLKASLFPGLAGIEKWPRKFEQRV